MENLMLISQASFFSHPGMGNVYHHDDNLKPKHPRAARFDGVNCKKETFTQPRTQAKSILVGDNADSKNNNNHTHDNTSSGSEANKLGCGIRRSITATNTSDDHHAATTYPTATPTTPPLTPSASADGSIATSNSNNSNNLKDSKPVHAVLPQEVAEDLVNKTEKRIESTLLKSPFLSSACKAAMAKMPKLHEDQVVRGELLGQGGFAFVFAVDITTPERLRNHNTKSNQKYVVKHLNSKLYDASHASNNYRKLHLGAKDIAMETRILASLNHEHIISVHGVSTGDLQAFATTQRTNAFFMILPRLSCTLAEKISTWKKERLMGTGSHSAQQQRRNSPRWWRKLSSDATLTEQEEHEIRFLCERLQIVQDLCSALEYLHERRIMHRDIKPPNIGFDEDGCLKLFDFGLAKELPPPEANNSHGSSLLSPFGSSSNGNNNNNKNGCMGNTGTTRYMAPEIIRREPYTTKVDVYAASIVCWEIMTLLKPYGNDTSGQFVKECVALYDDRPAIPSGSRLSHSKLTPWPKSLKKLVQQGWVKDQTARLTAKDMRMGLQQIIDKKQKLLSGGGVVPQQQAAAATRQSVSTTTTSSKPQRQQQQPELSLSVADEIML